jgi:hypothetical protein
MFAAAALNRPFGASRAARNDGAAHSDAPLASNN